MRDHLVTVCTVLLPSLCSESRGTCTLTLGHTHIHTQSHVYTHILSHSSIYPHSCTHTHTHSGTLISTHRHSHVYTHTFSHTHVDTLLHTYAPSHTCTHSPTAHARLSLPLALPHESRTNDKTRCPVPRFSTDPLCVCKSQGLSRGNRPDRKNLPHGTGFSGPRSRAALARLRAGLPFTFTGSRVHTDPGARGDQGGSTAIHRDGKGPKARPPGTQLRSTAPPRPALGIKGLIRTGHPGVHLTCRILSPKLLSRGHRGRQQQIPIR